MPDDDKTPGTPDSMFGCLWLWVFMCFMVTAVVYSVTKQYAISGMWTGVAGAWLLLVRLVETWRNKK